MQETLATPARVILFRHAEKPANEKDVQLSERGRQRAKALVAFFAVNLGITTNNPPAALFATRPTRKAPSLRPYETLEPLANSLMLIIQQPVPANASARLAEMIVKSPAFDGKTVIVCWAHDEMGDFARALGADPKPKEWKNDVFDRVWEISFKKEKVRCKTIFQELLPGDEHPPKKKKGNND